MKVFEERLNCWKKNVRYFDFCDLITEIKTADYIEEENRYNRQAANIKLQLENELEEIRVNTSVIQDKYEESLTELSNEIFVCIETKYLGGLYNYYPKLYFQLYEEITDYFLELYEKIDILINHYGEKSIYFDDLSDLQEDFLFYEKFVLQIEWLIKIIKEDAYLTEKDKAVLLEKIIPLEIFNIDYLLCINKLFKDGEFISFSLDEQLKTMYLERFVELSEIYQKFLNLKIVKFPSSKNVVEIKIRQLNIKNKYSIKTDEYVLPEL